MWCWRRRPRLRLSACVARRAGGRGAAAAAADTHLYGGRGAGKLVEELIEEAGDLDGNRDVDVTEEVNA